MTSPTAVPTSAPSKPKPWYAFFGTHEFIAGVALVAGWLGSLPKITIPNAIAGIGGLLAAFAQGRANNTP